MAFVSELRRVACNGCGAPLEVEPGTRFVTCNFCQASLSVETSESSTFTKVLDALEKRTARIEKKLDAAAQRDELDALEKNWKAERRRFLVTGKNGKKSEPSVPVGIAMIVVMLVVGALFAQLAASAGAPDGLAFFALLIGLAGAGAGIHVVVQARRLETARVLYEGEREAILDRRRGRRHG